MKKLVSFRALTLCAATFCFAVPVLSGCGGSSAIENLRNVSLPVRFNNSQSGTLNLRLSGGGAKGTLVVNPSSNALGLPAGTYPVEGRFVSPAGIELTGTFPAPLGQFTLSGQIPTSSDADGTFQISVAGQTFGGDFGDLTAR